MMITAIVFVPESLPRERRHGGGLRQFASGLSQVLRIRLYVGYMLTAALSGFTMMAYIANSSYVLQVQKGLRPLPFALFFASTALAQITVQQAHGVPLDLPHHSSVSKRTRLRNSPTSSTSTAELYQNRFHGT
jgi:hypothetical protein